MTKIQLSLGTISVSQNVIDDVKPWLVRLARAYHPARGRGGDVFDRLQSIAGTRPKEFTRKALEVLGVGSAF